MKRSRIPSFRLVLAAITISALMPLFSVVKAQDLIVNDWSSDGGGTFGLDWVNGRSYIYNASAFDSLAFTFDPTQNSAGNTSDGSMYLTLQWPLHSDINWNESWNDVQLAFYTPPFVPTNYISFNIAIKVDVTNSSPAINGSSYGAVELIVNNPWTTVVGYQTLSLTDGWQYISGSFAGLPNQTNSEAVLGFISNGGDSLTNTVKYWIGDITFTAQPTVNTNRPLLNLTKAPPPGLTCIASKVGGTYQRQMIQTVGNNYSWNTASALSQTTRYSMTIASFPNASYPGFESQMFLIPQAGLVSGASVDWYSTNVMDFFVGENSDGSGEGTLQYKINNPASWNTALVISKACAKGPIGTWSLSFFNNTNVTMTAPDGTSTNFNIPAGDAAYFQDPMYVYVGTLPNANGNIGQSSTISHVQVSGSAGSINDTFATLNPATWTLYAEDPAGVFINAPDSRYWLTWPLPDYGFNNVYATDSLRNNLAISQWLLLPASSTGWVNIGDNERLAVINQSTLNAAFGYAPTNLFLGLYHP